MIEIKGLTKAYSDQLLFENADFVILPGERVGLVGRNGHGKSTLLRLITGEETCDSGTISIPKRYRIGHLNQILNFTENTVLDEVCKGLVDDRDTNQWKAEKILMGLGFSEEDFLKSPRVFSGGYQMRVELARVLVSEPDMLLLDEPTNFLDIVSIRWIEKFLKEWKGEYVIISHDRDFMDSVVTHVVGIHRQKVRKIAGNTSNYYSTVGKDEEIHEKRRLNEEKKVKQIEEYISTFRSKARRAKSVQSSVKMLERMGRMEKLEDIRTLSFSFNETPFRPPVVMDVRGISFSYDGTQPYLINDLSFTLERGDKVCIVGANGKGKTTLSKMLAGVLKPAAGSVNVNPQVAMAYYEQGNTAKLTLSNTIEDEVSSSDPRKDKTSIRGICGAMMFSGSNALKRISVLSGGERSRVLLAKTLLFPSNLLILDEPTHHLDMESCSALFHAVLDYSGAAIVVTHDERLLHEVATKLIIFTGEKIKIFLGNYTEFLEQGGWGDVVTKPPVLVKKPEKPKPVQPAANKPAEPPANKPPMSKKDERVERAKQLAIRREKIGPLETGIKGLEVEIAYLEREQAEITNEIIKNSEKRDHRAVARLTRKLNEMKLEIDRKYDEMEALLKSLEEAGKEISE
ncbi:MAG: ABC-F family ATP-binding cassette domain-containing protein [Candidatus Omnitrophica bacterium]|nr:ABC-F family ATP-binding cassette domain-containing protein [Candidatus Omnitrophota bacterium]